MDVLYGRKRRYANNPKGEVNRAAGKAPSRFNPLSFIGCFNSGEPDHAAKVCPSPYNGAKQDSRRREYLVKRNTKRAAVAQVFYELCGEAVALSDRPAVIEETAVADVGAGGAQDTPYQALMQGTNLTDHSAKCGSEHNGQGFTPME